MSSGDEALDEDKVIEALSDVPPSDVPPEVERHDDEDNSGETAQEETAPEEERHEEEEEEEEEDPEEESPPSQHEDVEPTKTLAEEAPVLNDYDTDAGLAEVKELLHSKQGWTVKKHCRDGRVRMRKLQLSDDETELTWRAGHNKKIELKKVTEVRHGTALDPATVGISEKRPKGMTGTEVLRRSADGQKVARRCFSLVLVDRTFDIECADEDQAAKYCHAFQKLVEHAHLQP